MSYLDDLADDPGIPERRRRALMHQTYLSSVEKTPFVCPDDPSHTHGAAYNEDEPHCPHGLSVIACPEHRHTEGRTSDPQASSNDAL